MDKIKPMEGRFVTSVKVGPKGQIIIPKEVREMFNIESGDMLLMLADVNRGVAIQTFDKAEKIFVEMFQEKEE